MYNILFTSQAEKQIKAFPSSIKNRVLEKLKAMQNNPFSGDVKKLKMKHARYRLRVGDYRIIYDILKESVTVRVLTIRHRKDVYR